MIRFRGKCFQVREHETVLECLERSGEALASSCRSGVCQTCLLQATSGHVPPEAQQGLRASLCERGFFLACLCRPRSDLELCSESSLDSFESRVLDCQALAPGVVRVLLEKPPGFHFRAGQFLHVRRPSDGLSRPYSLASLPGDAALELHVKVHAAGRMSGWLAAGTGRAVELRGPLGDCSYRVQDPERPLLLVGTGTGLAPLYGIVRDALMRGHRAPITLCHAARSAEGLYLRQALAELARRHSRLKLRAWVVEAPRRALPGVCVGRLDQAVFDLVESLADTELYLCGSPALVATLKKRAYLGGAALSSIHADPFVVAPVGAL